VLSKKKVLKLYSQVGKDEKDVKEVLDFLKQHPRYVMSIDVLQMIWERLMLSIDDFHHTLINNPHDPAIVKKAESVRYYRKLFFNNVVFREIYCGCSFLPDLTKYYL
jgi:hypothetical protein